MHHVSRPVFQLIKLLLKNEALISFILINFRINQQLEILVIRLPLYEPRGIKLCLLELLLYLALVLRQLTSQIISTSIQCSLHLFQVDFEINLRKYALFYLQHFLHSGSINHVFF